MMSPRAAVRWSLWGRHTGWGAFGAPTGAMVYVLGITHAEFGPWGLRREYTLFDETAVWKQILLRRPWLMQASVATCPRVALTSPAAGGVRLCPLDRPRARQQWEARFPDTGMVYDFDTRAGGARPSSARIRGPCRDRPPGPDPPPGASQNRLIASSIRRSSAGVVTMMTALVVEFATTVDRQPDRGE
jgi:hypothetical protein